MVSLLELTGTVTRFMEYAQIYVYFFDKCTIRKGSKTPENASESV